MDFNFEIQLEVEISELFTNEIGPSVGTLMASDKVIDHLPKQRNICMQCIRQGLDYIRGHANDCGSKRWLYGSKTSLVGDILQSINFSIRCTR
jgi:hypothetical protein